MGRYLEFEDDDLTVQEKSFAPQRIVDLFSENYSGMTLTEKAPKAKVVEWNGSHWICTGCLGRGHKNIAVWIHRVTLSDETVLPEPVEYMRGPSYHTGRRFTYNKNKWAVDAYALELQSEKTCQFKQGVLL